MKTFKLIIGALLSFALNAQAGLNHLTTCEIDDPYWTLRVSIFQEDQNFYARIEETSGEDAHHRADVIRLEEVPLNDPNFFQLVQLGAPIRHPSLGGRPVGGKSNATRLVLPKSGEGWGTIRAFAGPLGSEIGSEPDPEEIECSK